MAVLSVEELLDRAAIRDLVDRYADAVNRRASAELAGLFTADGRWVVPGVGVTEGREAIAGLLDQLVGGFEVLVQTVHQGVVDVAGDRATARWYLSEVGIDRSGRDVHFVGVYQDTLVRDAAGWLFTRRSFDFLYRAVGTDTRRGYAFPELDA